MDPRFTPYIDDLDRKLKALVSMEPVTPDTLPIDTCKRGIYLLSEGAKHLYIGRSNHIRRRLVNHCQPSADHGKATFAFLLAREATGNLKAAYNKGPGSRQGLLADADFSQAFLGAKLRVKRMRVRFVEETDATKQALLEIYAAVVLQTPYNAFDNH